GRPPRCGGRAACRISTRPPTDREYCCSAASLSSRFRSDRKDGIPAPSVPAGGLRSERGIRAFQELRFLRRRLPPQDPVAVGKAAESLDDLQVPLGIIELHLHLLAPMVGRRVEERPEQGHRSPLVGKVL